MPTGHRCILLRSALLLTKLIVLSTAVTVDTESTQDMASVLWKALLSTAEQLMTHDSEEGCPNTDVCHPSCRDLVDSTMSFAVHVSYGNCAKTDASAEGSQGDASGTKDITAHSLHVHKEVSGQVLKDPEQPQQDSRLFQSICM